MRRLFLLLLVCLVVGLWPSRSAAHDLTLALPEARVARPLDDAALRVALPHHKARQTHQANRQGPHAIYHAARYPDTGAPGSCVWYAMSMRSDLYLSGAGSAANLANVARERGYQVGNLPAVGALVVIQRGVDFAYWPSAQYANPTYGHVAYVLAVYPDGSYLMASMASPAPFVVTDWRGRPGSGIQFIYG